MASRKSTFDPVDEAKGLKECRKELQDLDHDMWSLTILIIAKDVMDCWYGKAKFYQKLRMVFGLFAQGMNLTLQMYILHCVHEYVVGPAVHNMQSDYRQFHAEVFDPDGSFRQDLWHAWDDGPWMELCSSAMTKIVFAGVMILLWTMQMLGEVRSCYRFQRRVSRLPHSPEGLTPDDMVLEAKDAEGNDQFQIIYLDTLSRVAMYILVLLPRFGVCMVLWYVGCRWLNATESFGDLILNALALEFITGIDELILTNFFPERITKYLQETKFAYRHVHRTPEENNAIVLSDYKRSAFYAVLVMSWTLLYLKYLQQVLPGYKNDINEHCLGDWFTGKFKPLCAPFERDCFPYGPEDGHPLPSPSRLLQGLTI